MTRLKTALSSAVLAILASCGPQQADNPFRAMLPSLTGAGGGGAAATASLSDSLTREAIEASPFDLLLVAVVDRDAEATLQEVGENRGSVTWFSVDGIGVTLRNGVIISTRGLGDDLMGSDTEEVQVALRRGGGEATRIHDYLTGLDQIERRTILCTVTDLGPDPITIYDRTYATREMAEDCRYSGGQFRNRYWVDGSGTVWQSRQWLSPGVGFVDYQRL